MKSKPPNEQLPAVRKASRLERMDEEREPKAPPERQILIVHNHTYNWAAILFALAILIRALVAAAQSL